MNCDLKHAQIQRAGTDLEAHHKAARSGVVDAKRGTPAAKKTTAKKFLCPGKRSFRGI